MTFPNKPGVSAGSADQPNQSQPSDKPQEQTQQQKEDAARKLAQGDQNKQHTP